MRIPVKTVFADGIQMNYICFGSGKKTAVIIPGLSVKSVLDSAPMIAKDYALWTKDFTVYLFDRRSNLPEHYSLADMAEDTFKVIHALALNELYLFGTSQGAMISLLLAAGHQELVKKLVIGSGAVKTDKTAEAVIERWRHLAATGDKEGLYLDFGKKIYPEALFLKYEAALRILSHDITEEELKRFLILCGALNGFDAGEDVKSIRCPVLSLHAADDTIFSVKAAQELAKAFEHHPQFQQYIYPAGYGHAVYDTADDYKQRVYEFFKL